MKIVYIFGAGASASIDERVPVMANFFEKAIDMLDEDKKAFLIAFAFAEEARAFPVNHEVENLGVKMGTLGALSGNLKLLKVRAKTIEDRINKKLSITAREYKDAFKHDPIRKAANLEDVFSNVEAFKEKSSAAKQAYSRFQYVINGLFEQLDKDSQDNFTRAAHHDLSQVVANTNGMEHIFISFNYDLWLEKALFQKQIWLPRDGHGTYCFKYYSSPLDDLTASKDFKNGKVAIGNICEPKQFRNNDKLSSVKVLKPHGSLSWRFGLENKENGVVILASDENSSIAYNSSWAFPSSKFKDGIEMDMIPLIVPPTPNKIRSHPLFWETDKDVYDALLHADIVVTVGWSMPLTDRYLQNTILRALNNRDEQIKKSVSTGRAGGLISPKGHYYWLPSREDKIAYPLACSLG